jgi:hypothetical protein
MPLDYNIYIHIYNFWYKDDETNIEVYESLVDLIPSLCKVCKVGF